MIIKSRVATPPRFIFLAISLVSSVAISYEILLMRLLSIVQWQHFAYMIISLALLGYAASGTFIAIFRQILSSRHAEVFAISSLLFGVLMVVCFILGQKIPFNALEVIWNPRQLIFLSGLYLVFFVPFFFAATCIGIALSCLKQHISSLNYYDLLGAGSGALFIVALLFVVSVQDALRLLVVVAILASLLVTLAVGSRLRLCLHLAQAITLIVVFLILPSTWLDFRMSPYKGLSQALTVIDAHVQADYSNPLGLIAVVESPKVPFRHAAGLSLNAGTTPPSQLAVFTDGDSMSVITRHDKEAGSLLYMDDMIAALPYNLTDRPSVLVLGAGGGSDVLFALHHGARKVDAVELNPLMTQLVGETYAEFAGHLYDDERVNIYTGEVRGFVSRQRGSYDLIQLSLMDSFSTSGSGTQSLNESYLYTIEAVEEYMRLVTPGGLLAITRWLQNPPRDNLKLLATVLEALKNLGVKEPGHQIVLVRSWNISTLVVKKGRYTQLDIDTVREFSQARSFDMAYYPSMPASAANRFNILKEPYLFNGATALLGPDAADFIQRYKFNIMPATDDRPYFFHFFKWRSLPEMWAMGSHGGAAMIEWAYLILVATLAQAIIAGGILVLVPLTTVKRRWSSHVGMRTGGYFIVLGVAFMFVEMAFIQKLILFLNHPLYSVAVVLSGFLVFAGIGSRYSERLTLHLSHGLLNIVTLVVAAIIGVGLMYLLVLPVLFNYFIGLSDIYKIGISLLIIAPLAFCMGMPFPLGLSSLSTDADHFIPWAWGLNGFASVVSTSLATLLAIEFGFTVVVLLALALYFLAAVLIAHRR